MTCKYHFLALFQKFVFSVIALFCMVWMSDVFAVGNLQNKYDDSYENVWHAFYQQDYGLSKKLAQQMTQSQKGKAAADAYYILARIAELEADFSNALKYYEQFLSYRKKVVFSIHASRKIKIIRGALQQGNEVALTYFLRAIEQRNQGEVQSAIKTCRQLVANDPSNRLADDALHMIANILLMDQRDEIAAITAYRELLEKYPHSNYRDHAEFGLGMALEGANEFKKAKLSYLALRERHTNVQLFGQLRLVKDSFQSRYWHKRAEDRLQYLAEHQKLYKQGKDLLAHQTMLTSIGDRFQYQLYENKEHMRELWKLVPESGFKPTSLTHWITRSTKWKWESPQRLRACHRAGFTPVISYWYFGDEISPAYVTKNKEKYFKDIREHLIPFLRDVPEVIVLLEPEFNKNGIERWSEWDNVASQAVRMIKEAVPNAKVGLILGNWSGADHQRLLELIRPTVEQSDFVGFQDMVSTFESPIMFDPAHHPAQRSIHLAKVLFETFHKPLYIGYFAFSSYHGWDEKQASFLYQIKKNMPIYAALGVFGVGYFSLYDDAQHHGWFSEAEYHFGLLKTNGESKFSADMWQQLESEIREQNVSELRIVKPMLINHQHIDFSQDAYLKIEANLNQWARWQLNVVGKVSHALWRTYGAGQQIRVSWRGMADIRFFEDEDVLIEIRAFSVSGKRLAQKEAYVVHVKNAPKLMNQYPVKLLKNKTIFSWGDSQVRSAISKRKEAMQLQFNNVPSGMVVRLAGKKSVNFKDALLGTVLSIDIRLDQSGAEGLRIGLQDEDKNKVHVDISAYLHPDTAAGQWQRIHIPLVDFVKREKLRQRARHFNWRKVRKLSFSTSHAPYVMQIDRVQLQRWNFSESFYQDILAELNEGR